MHVFAMSIPEANFTPTYCEFRGITFRIEQILLETYLPSTSTLCTPIVPRVKQVSIAIDRLISSLPSDGIGLSAAMLHLTKTIMAGLCNSSLSPHYYGSFSGGATPAALLADILVTIINQNVQTHLPNESLSTTLEALTLKMVLQLFHMPLDRWKGRALTSGTTAGNILGLVCGREALLYRKLSTKGYYTDASIANMGLLEACLKSRVEGIQVLAALPHSSVYKAASVVGIGRKYVRDMGLLKAPWEFDMFRLEAALEDSAARGIISIVVAGFGEVNTGRFVSDLRSVRELVDRYGSAWIHVDAAFGIYARVLLDNKSENDCDVLASWAEQLDYADSVACGHHLLGVPYESGFFFTPTSEILHQTLFTDTYPRFETASCDIPSPINRNLESSRRFRALPIYATIVTYGYNGYSLLMRNLINHARQIARFILHHPAYILLPLDETGTSELEIINKIFIVVLFRAKEKEQNLLLHQRINNTGKIYVTATLWCGEPAVRCFVGNWRTSATKNCGWGIVEQVLTNIGGML